jgi:hypothetical protein
MRIEREVFVASAPPVWEQAAADSFEIGKRLGVDAVEVDGVIP